MRKILLMVLLSALAFTGCKKEETSKFNYDLNMLYGTWDINEIYSKGEWIDITKPGFENLAASATFNSNGSYQGKGALGNGSGTYDAKENTIICSVDGKEYARYDVISLTNQTCELNMIMGGDSMKIRCKKK